MPEMTMSQNAIILLAPDLNISPDTFEKAWQEDPECQKAGSIEFKESPEYFDLNAQATAAIVTLTALGAAIAKDLIVHLVKRALTKADAKHEQEVEVVQVPDAKTGLPLFIVRRKGDNT
ncbi:MAG: hypothetical protein AAF591_22160 [Verrucomicrobiota bacterium]